MVQLLLLQVLSQVQHQPGQEGYSTWHGDDDDECYGDNDCNNEKGVHYLVVIQFVDNVLVCICILEGFALCAHTIHTSLNPLQKSSLLVPFNDALQFWINHAILNMLSLEGKTSCQSFSFLAINLKTWDPIFDRPSVAGAVLQTALWFIHWFID